MIYIVTINVNPKSSTYALALITHSKDTKYYLVLQSNIFA